MKAEKLKLVIVIPAYNEEKTIEKVVRGIPKNIDGVGKIEIVVVDDSSRDSTSSKAKLAGARVLRHPINLGAGGAVLTGIIYGQRRAADIVITLDADGQHDPKEIGKLVKKYLSGGADLVIGSRFLSKSIKKMPAVKKFGNRSFSYITYFLSGKMLTDTQSGFRLFGPMMIEALTTVDLAGYEFCSETIMIAHKKRLVIHEVPITTIYNQERRGGQDPVNGINILMKLIYRKLVG